MDASVITQQKQFTTGPSTLPDTGVLSYNGCVFSPLFATSVSGRAVLDDANRTVKYMLYTITVDGYVTMPAAAGTINPNMQNMRQLLSAQGGVLTYTGRGNDIVVNAPGNPNKDVAWGPVPEILEYQPLGGTKSAKIKWTVKVAYYEQGSAALTGGGGPDGGGGGRPGTGNGGGGGGGGFNAGVVVPGPAKAF